MGNVFSFSWEIPFMEWLQSFESGLTTALATFFTMLGEEYLLILVLGFIYWCYRKDLARRFAFTAIGGAMLGSMLKSLVLRRRPYMDNPSVKCIRASDPSADIMQISAQGFSFPSLHGVLSSALFGTLARFFRKKWTTVLAVFFTLCIGLSRNYLGVHYPTDVLAGWTIGLVLVFLLDALEKKLGYKAVFGVLIAAGVIGLFYCRDNEFFTLYGTLIGSLLGFSFEEKYVRFEKAMHWLSYVIRPLLGIAIFLAISSLLKLALKAVPFADDHLVTLLLRSLRYAISMFVIIGVYPLCFHRSHSAEKQLPV